MRSWNPKMTKLKHCICIFIAMGHMFCYDHVDGRSISSHKTIEHAGATKIIQNKNDDIIHCVDIYKQPAFDHPLLKNHTIQMKPSSYPRGMEIETKALEVELLKYWHKNGECPEGTIPIVRSPHHRPWRKTTFSSLGTQPEDDPSKEHEYAAVALFGGNFFGGSGRFNLWKPTAFAGEFSLAQIWVVAGHGTETNTVEVGWQVLPGTGYPRLFIYWTSDDYRGTGCYNLECPGFVQTSNKLIIGGKMGPVSEYDGDQYEFSIYINKDKKSGNWWLRILEIDVGYWPGSIFNKLSDRANTVSWGGEIINLESQGRHTSTQMGSGHFPSEGFKKASYIRNIRYVEESGDIKDADPHSVLPLVSKPNCYDLQMGNVNNWGTNFFYGGPGYSDKC